MGTSHGVVHCTSKNQINQEQLQEKCRREVGVMLISVRTQLPDDIKVQIKGEVVRELCPKDEGVVNSAFRHTDNSIPTG